MINRDKDEIEMSMKEIMDGETDLSCALLGASLIDLHLKILLEKFFIDGKTSERILSNTGFAGNLRARTDLAYVLGLINKDNYYNSKYSKTGGRFHSILGIAVDEIV